MPEFLHFLLDAIYGNGKWDLLKKALGLNGDDKNLIMDAGQIKNKNSMSKMSHRTRFAAIRLIFKHKPLFIKCVSLGPDVTVFRFYNWYKNKAQTKKQKSDIKLLKDFVSVLPKKAQF